MESPANSVSSFLPGPVLGLEGLALGAESDPGGGPRQASQASDQSGQSKGTGSLPASSSDPVWGQD